MSREDLDEEKMVRFLNQKIDDLCKASLDEESANSLRLLLREVLSLIAVVTDQETDEDVDLSLDSQIALTTRLLNYAKRVHIRLRLVEEGEKS